MKRYARLFLFLLVIANGSSASSEENDPLRIAQTEKPSSSFIKSAGREAMRRISIAEPIAHYKLDGDAMDASKSKLHGFNAECIPTADRFGNVNGALKFDGINDFLTLPINIVPKNFDELTICAWIKPAGDEGYRVLMNHDSGEFDRGFTMNQKEGKWHWHAYGGPETERITITTDVNAGAWYFVAVTYNQTLGTIYWQVNDQSVRRTGRCGWGFDEIRVGMDIHSVKFYRGAMDDIRIYNKALSPAAIQRIYEMTEDDDF